MTVQASDFLPVLPFQVPRVSLDTGKPTKAQMDWEQAWRAAQVKASLSLQGQFTQYASDNDTAHASFTSSITTLVGADSAQVDRIEALEIAVDTPTTGLSAKVTHLTSVVGDASTGLVKAVDDVTSEVTVSAGSYGTLHARLSNTDLLIGDASSGLIQAMNSVTGEVSAARQGQASLAANFQDVRYLTLDLANGTSLASQLGSISTTVGGHTSTLATLGTSVNGILAEYRVVLTLDGITGGYKVVGVQKADGTGPVFTFVIDANTEIHGDLVVTGTINTPQLANSAVGQLATGSSAGTSASATITTTGGQVEIIANFAGQSSYSSTSGTNVSLPAVPTDGTLTLKRGSTTLTSQVNNVNTYVTYGSFFAAGGGAVSYSVTYNQRVMQTAITYVDAPAAGTYTYTIEDDKSGALFLEVKELKAPAL